MTESRTLPQQPGSYAWPNSARFAVSLTYDDAIPSQRTSAVQQLSQFGVPATFFLTGTSGDLSSNRSQWQGLVAQGHELASHTMNHPCDGANDWVPEGFATQDYDLPRMEAELEETRELLENLTAPSPYTFAYPCGETSVGEQRDQTYIPVIMDKFLAARSTVGALADPATVDLHNVPSFDGATTTDVLLDLVDRAEEAGGWLVLTFHGVGGDYLVVQLDAHAALLQALQSRSSDVWVAPFGTVAKHIADLR